MDAISFVLGVRAAHLRGHHLLDLIHRSAPIETESNGLVSSPLVNQIQKIKYQQSRCLG